MREDEAAAAAAGALAAGAPALGLALPPGAVERLLRFLAELRRWNRAYNLVADAPDLVWARRHLLDSLSIAAPLRRLLAGPPEGPAAPGPAAPDPATPRPTPRVLDLGSGAGLPGIPLAVVLPTLRFTLLDGNGKKARFCRHAAAGLGLGNVEVAESRAEDFAPAAPFDAAVVRAVGRLADVRALARPHCAGPILAMKGRRPRAELAELAARGGAPAEVTALRVPGLGAERHLVVLR